MQPLAAKQFAHHVVQRLREAGFESLWAGGCVRDMLLGREPNDYDVATAATPEQVREVFGRRRTLAIGAAFGVITVLGSKQQGQIEVATFRCDAEYSDGRRPDSVSFSTAEEDAQRRDFTINGLFYDPLAEQVIDYVAGQADLQAGVIRAIRDPFERIAEDKLRMLRAVRFAATFDFQLETQTRAAICQQAGALQVVSAERIAAEMQRMLVHPQRCRAMELLRDCQLLVEVLPEAKRFDEQPSTWSETRDVLGRLASPCFPVAFAALIRLLVKAGDGAAARTIGKRWKLSNDDLKLTAFLIAHLAEIRTADQVAWPQLQRILIHDNIQDLMALAEAVAGTCEDPSAALERCREKLELPQQKLNPPLLLDGNDLRQLIQPGPVFKEILTAVRDAQLEGQLTSQSEALDYVRVLLSQHPEQGTQV